MNLDTQNADTIDAHFAKCSSNPTDHDAIVKGFVAFTYDMLDETREQLAGDCAAIACLALDIAYSVRQDDDFDVEVTAGDCIGWLIENRKKLVAAIDAEIAER